MRREVMETIAGIEIFPLIALVIFVTFFAVMFYWVITLDKSYLDKNSNLPLEENNDDMEADDEGSHSSPTAGKEPETKNEKGEKSDGKG